MALKFRIVETDEHEGEIYLGSVSAPKDMTEAEAEAVMSEAWDNFQETKPDTDGEFEEWLVERHGFKSIPDDIKTFNVGD